MAERKRRTVKSSTTSMPVNKIGKVIKNEVVHAEPSKESSLIGAVLAGDMVDIIDITNYSDGWVKIKKSITNVTGYINRDSVV